MKVTIKCERADGQFTVAQTEVLDHPDAVDKLNAALKINRGFLDAYQRAIDLPE